MAWVTTQILHRNYLGFSKAFAEHNSHYVQQLVYKMSFIFCKFFLNNGVVQFSEYKVQSAVVA